MRTWSVLVMFVKLLKASDRKTRDLRLTIPGEFCPCSLLSASRSALRLLHEKMLFGIVPVKPLNRRSSVFRLTRAEN